MIMKLASTKSCGIDKISASLIKTACPIILSSLTKLFNVSFKTGIFPYDWKIARSELYLLYINLILNQIQITIGRISVLPDISKIMERLTYNAFYKSKLTQNNLLSKFQSDFRALHSICTVLLSATTTWLENLGLGLLNGVLFIDLKKAFDTVDRILLKKLEYYEE